MRLSRESKDAKIVELYKSGASFKQLQKRYRKSPNYIAKLVQGIEVACAACGKPKGKVRFHAHHPDRLNRPDYTIPLCPSCHPKEEAKLRQQKEDKSRSSLSAALPKTENIASQPKTASLSSPSGPLSPKAKKVLKGVGVGLVVASIIDILSPGFFDRRGQEIQDHWRKPK